MDFRQYDPSTGRFYNIDLLAEQAYNMTPYRFGFNNPLLFSDPTGLKELYQSMSTGEMINLMWDATPENGSTFWSNNSGIGGSLIFDGAITNFGDWGSGGGGVGYQGNYAGTIGNNGFFMESGMVGGFVLENFVAIVNSQGQIQNGQALLNHVQNGISNTFNNSGNNLQTAPFFGDGFVKSASPYNTLGGIGFFIGEVHNWNSGRHAFKYGQRINGIARSREVLTRANKINSLKWGTRFAKLGVAANFVGTVFSVTNIINDYDKNGNGISDVNKWDVGDAVMGTVATGSGIASLLVTAGVLASNPVGWGIAIVSTAYFTYRLIDDLNNQ